jgi:hypothetical protein
VNPAHLFHAPLDPVPGDHQRVTHIFLHSGRAQCKRIFQPDFALAFEPVLPHSAHRSKRQFRPTPSGAITPIIGGAFMPIRDTGRAANVIQVVFGRRVA